MIRNMRSEAGVAATPDQSYEAIDLEAVEAGNAASIERPIADVRGYRRRGTRGTLSVPYLDLWYNRNEPSWWEPIEHERLPAPARDPLGLQIRNFCAVIRGAAEPLVSGREGLNTLKVIAAVKQAAATGRTVDIG